MQNGGSKTFKVTEEKEREYAEDVIVKLSARADEYSRSDVQNCLVYIYQHPQYWRIRKIPGIETQTFDSFRQFIEEKPPYGLDWTWNILHSFLVPGEEKLWSEIEGEIPKAKKNGRPLDSSKEGNYNYLLTKSNSSRERIVAVLKRDAPAIAKRVISGEISAAEGMRQAGKKKPVITIPVTVEGFAKAIIKKLNDNERNELKQMI
jgi:hypothetical protein